MMNPLGRTPRLRRPLATLVAAAGISAFGDSIYAVAFPIAIFSLTGSAAAVGLGMGARLLPFLLLSLPGGIVADRCRRKAIVIGMSLLGAGSMFVLAGIYSTPGSIWLFVALTVVAASAGTLAMPAQSAFVAEVARLDELQAVNAYSRAAEHAASVAGPLLTAALVLAGAIPVAFVLNGATFLASAFLVGAIGEDRIAAHDRDRRRDAPRRLASLFSGYRRIAFRAAPHLTLDAAVSCAAGALTVLPILVTTDLLHLGSEAAALLGSASAAGAIVGSVASGGRALGIDGLIPRSLMAVGVGAGAMLLGGGLLIVAIGVTVVVAAIVLLDSVNVASLQASSPNGEVGRAFGLLHTCAAVWLLAGSFATPVIAGVAGTGGAIAVSFSAVGILALASAVLFARQAKDVNRVRLPG